MRTFIVYYTDKDGRATSKQVMGYSVKSLFDNARKHGSTISHIQCVD